MPDTLNKSKNNDGTGDQTPVPRGPGILTVKLGWAYRLSLPDDQERWQPYAIGEYEGFQVSTEAMAVYHAKGAVSWAVWHRPFQFEVSASPSTELTVSMFVRDGKTDMSPSSSGEYENRVIPLGMIRLNPFLETTGQQKIDFQHGTENVEVEISYTEKETSHLGTRDVWSICGESSSGEDLVYVEKKDTGRSYGMKTIDIHTVHDVVDLDLDINMARSLSLRSGIQHTLITPLKFLSSPRGQ